MKLPGRTVFVHVGTHKTGSTAVQYFLARNSAALAHAGLFVPRAGRLAEHPEGCGHHNVALELFVPAQYDPALGSLADVVAEVAASGLPRACISSEQFETAYGARAGLERLRNAFAAIGYRVRIIVYLRPQADYFESLYAEIAKGGHFYEFGRFLDEIVANGSLWGGLLLSYDTLLETFVGVFGRRNVSVRAYHRGADPTRILREFGRLVGLSRAQLARCDVGAGAAVNARGSFGATMAAVYASAQRRAYEPQTATVPAELSSAIAQLEGAFDPLRFAEIVRIVRRFGRGNVRVAVRFGCIVGCVSAERLWQAVRSGVRAERSNERRRRLLDRMAAQLGQVNEAR